VGWRLQLSSRNTAGISKRKDKKRKEKKRQIIIEETLPKGNFELVKKKIRCKSV
jgi:hypothetical protein